MTDAAPGRNSGLRTLLSLSFIGAAPCNVARCDGGQTMSQWSTTEEQRGSKRERKKGPLRGLCNPQVLKAIISVSRFLYELLRIFQQH